MKKIAKTLLTMITMVTVSLAVFVIHQEYRQNKRMHEIPDYRTVLFERSFGRNPIYKFGTCNPLTNVRSHMGHPLR